MNDACAGAPMKNLKWSRKSARSISEELKNKNIEISPNTVSALLKEKGFSLKVNRKTIAETYRPDRNLQFEIITEKKKNLLTKENQLFALIAKKKNR